MASDADAVGQMIDAGLLGTSLDSSVHGDHAEGRLCANCDAPLAGRFCRNCGQRGAVHRSMSHLLEEFFHLLFHFDGKLWRTLPLLLVRPGILTRRYVQGQRVRFVSPIALFLFSIFLMFFALSTLDPAATLTRRIAMEAEDRAEIKKDLDEAKADLSKAAREDSSSAGAVKAAAGAVAMAQHITDQPEDSGLQLADLDWRNWSKRLADRPELTVFNDPQLTERARESLRDPDLFLYKLKNVASEYAFLMVPLSVPFLWLVFIGRRRVYLFDHVIFVLHSLSFMAIFVVLGTIAFRLHWGAQLLLWPLLVPPVHLFFHLMGAYQLGVGGALWRTVFLLMVAVCVLFFYLTVILGLGLLD